MAADERKYRWERVQSADEQWKLVDCNSGQILRVIAKVGPHLGQPVAVYHVFLGPKSTDHPSLDEAKRAALASVP